MYTNCVGFKQNFLQFKNRFVSNRQALFNMIIFLAAALILFTGISRRLSYFSKTSKDVDAYILATQDLFSGVNPYLRTIQTYSATAAPGDHGYAYLPGFLYLFSAIYTSGLKYGFNYVEVLKIPVLLCDIGVGLILFYYLARKDKLAALFGLAVWVYNPLSTFRSGYSQLDPIPVFILLLALIYLGKDDVLSGALYALSIVFKTYPIILLPLFLLKAKSWVRFMVAGGIVGLFLLLPFITNLTDITTLIQGSLLVHTDRFVQGRPFLFYISYFYKVELFQIIPLKFYSYMAMFFSWVLIVFFAKVLKVTDKYVLTTVAFVNFYLFTPVLNRTYFLWFIPTLVLGCFSLGSGRRFRWLYYFCVGGVWLFLSWYLVQWEDGFHIWRP